MQTNLKTHVKCNKYKKIILFIFRKGKWDLGNLNNLSIITSDRVIGKGPSSRSLDIKQFVSYKYVLWEWEKLQSSYMGINFIKLFPLQHIIILPSILR